MELRLLGDVEVTADTGSIPIDAPLERRFLAALALAPGAISVDALADALWGDAVPENWKPALRNVVARVRSRLAPIGGGDDHVVVTTATGYRLAPACTLDVHATLADVENAAQALADGDPDRAFDLGRSAADRLAQPLLADVDAGWVAGYRARVDAARVRSLQVAAAAARDTGHPGYAVDLARRAVADNPLDEESHRQLIAALAAAGDRAGALRGYEQCRRLLAAELGIAPAPATVALHLDVLGREPPRPARVRSDKPLLGREHELATLREVVVPGAIVTITGTGGLGKSHLAAAFAGDVGDGFEQPAVVVELDGMGDSGQLLTTLATALAVSAGDDDAFDNVVVALAPRGPTLLVLDGVDQVLDAAATMIVAIAERCPNVALLVTCRTPVGVPGETIVRPEPLDADGAGRACFVAYTSRSAARLDTDDATQAAIAAVCRAVGGIPLAIELAAAQAAEVSLADLADRLASDRLDDEGRAAELVDGAIRSTLALLDDAELAVFRRMSLIGGPVDLGLIQATVSDERVPATRVVRILAALAERALVRLDRSRVRWTYDQHPLLRRAGRDGVSPAEARRVNDRLATAVFARLPPTPTASPPVDDIVALLPAVRGLFAAALDGDGDLPTALRLASWLHRFWAARGLDEGRRWLQRLLEAEHGDGPERGPAEFVLGYLLNWSGHPDAGAEHLTAATRLLDGTDPLLVRAHYFLASTAENRRPGDARRHYAAAIAAAHSAGLPDLVPSASIGLAIVEFEGGDRSQGLARYETALAAIERRADEDQVVVLLPQYALMLISLGRFEDAHRALLRVERALGDDVRITTMVAAAARARLERHRGRVDVARRHALRADAMIASAGVGRLDGLAAPTLALVALADGDPDAATSGLARAVKAAIDAEQFGIVADVLDAATIVAASTGRNADAKTLHAATEALRRRAQFGRGDPEQAELDVALAGVGDRDDSDEPDLATAVEVVIGLAAS